MKDKIAEVIGKYDLKPDTNKYMTDWQSRDLAQDIASLIAKELKESTITIEMSDGNKYVCRATKVTNG